jgi:hypothetical protein
MRRREFMTLIGGAAVLPRAAHAQQASPLPRVGLVSIGSWRPRCFSSVPGAAARARIRRRPQHYPRTTFCRRPRRVDRRFRRGSGAAQSRHHRRDGRSGEYHREKCHFHDTDRHDRIHGPDPHRARCQPGAARRQRHRPHHDGRGHLRQAHRDTQAGGTELVEGCIAAHRRKMQPTRGMRVRSGSNSSSSRPIPRTSNQQSPPRLPTARRRWSLPPMEHSSRAGEKSLKAPSRIVSRRCLPSGRTCWPAA